MIRENMTEKINWLGTEYEVKVTWETENDDIQFIRCLINNKEIVKYFRGRWKGPRGDKYSSSEFTRLQKCCLEKFKYPRNTIPAIAPLFTILLGEQM